jgi:excisionase family DNA binding protein
MTNEIQSPQSAAAGVELDGFLTKKELALRLKITTRTIENWQRRGVLPFVKVGKIVLFHWPDVLEHLKANFRVCRRTAIK